MLWTLDITSIPDLTPFMYMASVFMWFWLIAIASIVVLLPIWLAVLWTARMFSNFFLGRTRYG